MTYDASSHREYQSDTSHSEVTDAASKIIIRRNTFAKPIYGQLWQQNDDLPPADFIKAVEQKFRVKIAAGEEAQNTVYYVGATHSYSKTAKAINLLFDFISEAQSHPAEDRQYRYDSESIDRYSRANARYTREFKNKTVIAKNGAGSLSPQLFSKIISDLQIDDETIKSHEDNDHIYVFADEEQTLLRIEHALKRILPLQKQRQERFERRKIRQRSNQYILEAHSHLATGEKIEELIETRIADEQRRADISEDKDEKANALKNVGRAELALAKLLARDGEAELSPLINTLKDAAKNIISLYDAASTSEVQIQKAWRSYHTEKGKNPSNSADKRPDLAHLEDSLRPVIDKQHKEILSLAKQSDTTYTTARKFMAFAHQMAVDAGIEYEAAKAGPNKYKAPRKMPPIPPEQYQAAIDEAISRYHIPEPPEIEPEQENEYSELQEAESLTEKQNIKEELQINEGYKRMASKKQAQTEEIYFNKGVDLSPLAQHLLETGDKVLLETFAHSDLISPLEIIKKEGHDHIYGFKLSKTKHSNSDERFNMAKEILTQIADIGNTQGFGVLTGEYIADYINVQLETAKDASPDYKKESAGFLSGFDAHDFFVDRNKTKLLKIFEDELGIRLVPSAFQGNKGFDVFVKEENEEDAEFKQMSDLEAIKKAGMVLEIIGDASYHQKTGFITQHRISNWLKDAENAYRQYFAGDNAIPAVAAKPAQTTAATGAAAGKGTLKAVFNPEADYKDIFIVPKRTEAAEKIIRRIKRAAYHPISKSQEVLYNSLVENNMNIVMGAAATGKTDAAISAAIEKLASGQVDKIVITRPAVEAGENLGFLPGDMKDKLDPYLQPLFEVLTKRLCNGDIAEGKKLLNEMKAQGVIEIVPLAFMRGRTMTKTFVIVDEAQNASIGQLKAVMTRLGPESHMMINGDKSQSDLPQGISGLDIVAEAFENTEGFNIVRMDPKDAKARDPLVLKMIEVFEDLDLPDSTGGIFPNAQPGAQTAQPAADNSLSSVFMSHAMPMLINDFKEVGYTTGEIVKIGLEIQEMESCKMGAVEIIDALETKIEQRRSQQPKP